MKKVKVILSVLMCTVSLNLAFAGSSKSTDGQQSSTNQPAPERLRFQR
jgi:preprotein translocase subunit SecG